MSNPEKKLSYYFDFFVKYFHALRYIPSPFSATSMRLPCRIIYHSIRLTDLDARKNLRVSDKKNTKAAPKGLVFAYFFYARIHHFWLVFFRCFPRDGQHWKNTVMQVTFFFLSFPFIISSTIGCVPESGAESNRFAGAKVYFVFLRRCKFKPCGFCKKSPRLRCTSGCILSQKICQPRNTNLLLAPETR